MNETDFFAGYTIEHVKPATLDTNEQRTIVTFDQVMALKIEMKSPLEAASLLSTPTKETTPTAAYTPPTSSKKKLFPDAAADDAQKLPDVKELTDKNKELTDEIKKLKAAAAMAAPAPLETAAMAAPTPTPPVAAAVAAPAGPAVGPPALKRARK